MRDAAIISSIAFQHGVPLDALASAVTRDDRGQPASIIGALLDLIGFCRKLGIGVGEKKVKRLCSEDVELLGEGGTWG